MALSHPDPQQVLLGSDGTLAGRADLEQSCCLPGLCGVGPTQHLKVPVLGRITRDTPPRDALLTQFPGQTLDVLLEHGNLQLWLC